MIISSTHSVSLFIVRCPACVARKGRKGFGARDCGDLSGERLLLPIDNFPFVTLDLANNDSIKANLRCVPNDAFGAVGAGDLIQKCPES